MNKDRFLKAYANLPVPEREQIIVLIDGKPYTWNVAFNEINSDTQLGQKILKKLEDLGVL